MHRWHRLFHQKQRKPENRTPNILWPQKHPFRSEGDVPASLCMWRCKGAQPPSWAVGAQVTAGGHGQAWGPVPTGPGD